MRRWVAVVSGVLIAAALGAATPARAADPAVSPAVLEAIKGLTSDSFKAREKAVEDLHAATGAQLRALIAAGDKGAKDEVTQALEFDVGLTRWAMETMKLPNDERKAAVEFGLRSEVVPVIASAFAPNVSRRLSGVRQLGKFEDEQVTALLARLLNDPELKVQSEALNEVVSRKPSRELVDAVWNKAIGKDFILNPILLAMNNQADGEEIDFSRFQQLNQALSQDACAALIGYKSPLVSERIVAALKLMEQYYSRCPPGTAPLTNMGTGAGPKNLFKLVDAYKPREAYGTLYRLGTATLGQVMNVQGQNGFYQSSRSQFVGEFLKLIGEKPDDYKLKPGKFGSGYSFPAENDETHAIDKMNEWWEKHKQEYSDAGDTPPATQPDAK